MIRTINFFCVAALGLSILAVYHTSEKTRVARVELSRVNRQIADERTTLRVLQTEWERLAGPARIQALAEARLGMSDTSSVELSSFDQLPRRGEDAAPLGNTPLRAASAQVPAVKTQAPATDDGL
jgi:cell division protein FtsL